LRVQNRQCGICASDLSLLNVEVDPSVAPAALPGNTRFYLGHEVVGEVAEIGPGVTRFAVGQRVMMETRFIGPNCNTQEIDPPCDFCAQGQHRLCENASLGRGPVGVGGGWGDGYTAHQDELWPVPEDLTDDQAILLEPASIALHSVLRKPPQPGSKVLVIGAGIIGLFTIKMIKLVEPAARVVVLARYPHQAAAAQRMGADDVVGEGDLYAKMADLTSAKLYTSLMNKGMLEGGFELVFDCVGNASTVTDALRWARAGSTVVVVGITLSQLKIDITPIWYREVDLIGAYSSGIETWQGKKVHTLDLTIEMMQQGRLDIDGLITHRFPFEQYRRAIATAINRRHGSIKVAFEY
jgi:threonine dehydrogenase-like Zn-dependent dehydrogenase